MEKSGLINKLAYSVGSSHNKIIELNQSELMLEKEKSLSKVYQVVKDIGESKKISELVIAEKVLIQLDSVAYSKNPEFIKSMRIASDDMDRALKCLDLHKNPKSYKENSVAVKDNKNGLPYDTFRSLINSNKTRLLNRGRTGELSGEEKKVISARIRNMDIADKEYQKLQMKSLGIEIKSKDKGLER